MKRLDGSALALGLEEATDLTRGHRDHEPARRRDQESLGVVVEATSQVDEPVADEGGLADEEVLGRPMTRAPLDEGCAHPEPCRSPNDRMGDAVGERIAPSGRAGLEDRPRQIPLKKVNGPPGGAGEVHELVNQETLARARESGEEDHPLTGQVADPFRQPSIGVHYQTSRASVAHSKIQRSVSPCSTGLARPLSGSEIGTGSTCHRDERPCSFLTGDFLCRPSANSRTGQSSIILAWHASCVLPWRFWKPDATVES